MSVVAQLDLPLRPDTRSAAIEAFLARRVFEECAAAVPGFLGARLLEAEDAEDTLTVISEWRETADYEAWLAHPVRAKQEEDLIHFLAGSPRIRLYRRLG